LFLPCKVKDFLENNKHFSKKNKKNSEFLEETRLIRVAVGIACDYL
jgi:hypothetical protein